MYADGQILRPDSVNQIKRFESLEQAFNDALERAQSIAEGLSANERCALVGHLLVAKSMHEALIREHVSTERARALCHTAAHQPG